MSKRIFNVVEYIPIGKQNAIAMSELAKRIDISQREARKAVFNARRKGAVICSTCSGDKSAGYYRPISVDEARPYIRLQESRIASAEIVLRPVKEFAEGKNGA